MVGSGSGSIQTITDPDPLGPKTYRTETFRSGTLFEYLTASVADPDPNLDPDPHVFGSPGFGSFYH
jgi:hypothetical protein